MKQAGREVAQVQVRYGPYVVAVVSTVASIIVPGAGYVITGLAASVAPYIGATAARAEGESGRDAREEGRDFRRRIVIYGLIGSTLGTGVGAIGSGAVSLTTAGTALTTVGGIYQTVRPYINPAGGDAGADDYVQASQDAERRAAQEAAIGASGSGEPLGADMPILEQLGSLPGWVKVAGAVGLGLLSFGILKKAA